MSDIFNRNVSNLAGIFTSDRAKLMMKGNLGVLVQRLQFTYAQTVTRLYEVGSNGPNGASNIYYVGGRTQGQLSVDRVVGPSGTVQSLYTQYGDVCKAKGNNIELTLQETDCSVSGGQALLSVPVIGSALAATVDAISGRNGSQTYVMKNCVITQVSIGVAAQDMIISENTSMMYSSLEVV